MFEAVESLLLHSDRLRRQNVPTASCGRAKIPDVKICPQCKTTFPNEHTACSHDAVFLDFAPGTEVRSKYRIERTLGRGGMGTVYLAEHLLLRQPRALKFISFSGGPHGLKRFYREAQAATQLSHANIVKVMDLDQADDGSPFIAMEYVPGQDLEQALHAGPMPVARAAHIARGVAEGLGCAHAQGILHRDVKPPNIRLARGIGGVEIPKLLDFGIAAVRASASELTRTQGQMLTPPYAAPEQWNELPAEKMDGRVDLYALGGVLFEMLTGELCFRGDQGWMHQHLSGERRPPSSLRPELAQWPELDALVLRMLAIDPDHRPRDVAEFLRELDQAQGKSTLRRIETQVKTRAEVPRRETAVENIRASPSPKSRASRWPMIGGIALFVVIAAAFVVWKTWPILQTGPNAGTVRDNPLDGLRYAWIPPGNFQMGCSEGDSECQDDEKPAHPVTISEGFWMGQTPVTVGAWKKYRAATGAPALLSDDGLGRKINEAGPEDMPVVLVTWDQAAEFCRWSGGKLPTEAQWEYAARAGSHRPRYGDPDAIAWYLGNSGTDAVAEQNPTAQRLRENGNLTHLVGQKQPNAWHLYDMLGNVLEWTADWYDPSYYSTSPNKDHTAPGTETPRAVRGASWLSTAATVRVSARYDFDPSRRLTGVGFRCVESSVH
jgi:serine/threonine-protein kinase